MDVKKKRVLKNPFFNFLIEYGIQNPIITVPEAARKAARIWRRFIIIAQKSKIHQKGSARKKKKK